MAETGLSVNLEPGMIMQRILFIYLKFMFFFGSYHVYFDNVARLWEKNKGILIRVNLRDFCSARLSLSY